MTQQACILIPSCDKYADLWDPFFSLFWKYWVDCPYLVYLGSNRITYLDSRVRSVLVGDDSSWATGVSRMLDQLDYPYVIMVLEDFLFLGHIDTAMISRCVDAIENLGGNYLRLKPDPPPDFKIEGAPFLGGIDPGAPYRVSLQAAIWRKECLLNVLKVGESPWEMELVGSQRADSLKGFYSVWEPVLHYRHGVERGKWLRYTVRMCWRENILLDLQRRPLMTRSESAWRWLRLYCFTAPLKLFSLRHRFMIVSTIRQYLNRLGYLVVRIAK